MLVHVYKARSDMGMVHDKLVHKVVRFCPVFYSKAHFSFVSQCWISLILLVWLLLFSWRFLKFHSIKMDKILNRACHSINHLKIEKLLCFKNTTPIRNGHKEFITTKIKTVQKSSNNNQKVISLLSPAVTFWQLETHIYFHGYDT